MSDSVDTTVEVAVQSSDEGLIEGISSQEEGEINNHELACVSSIQEQDAIDAIRYVDYSRVEYFDDDTDDEIVVVDPSTNANNISEIIAESRELNNEHNNRDDDSEEDEDITDSYSVAAMLSLMIDDIW